MSPAERDEGPRRLADEEQDALVTMELLALRSEAPSERSRHALLQKLGLGARAQAEPATVAEAPAPPTAGTPERGAPASVRLTVRGLLLGLVLGLVLAVLRHYSR